jgi:hypothetical protein
MKQLPLTCVAGLCVALQLSCAYAQAPDNEAMMRWATADLVSFHIVGDYVGKPYIASNGAGQADVTDRVVIDLKMKLSESRLVGKPVILNSKSTATNLRDREPKCKAPVLKGEYEHFELLGIKDGLGGAMEMEVRTTYPPVDVAQFCSASFKTVPAATKQRPEELVIPSPVMLGMGIEPTDALSISKDRKSLISKRGDWTWTFTPSVAAK